MTLKKIKSQVVFTKDFAKLTKAYQEIAVMKIQKARRQILKTRAYIDGLLEVFVDVRASHQKEMIAELKKKGKIKGDEENWRFTGLGEKEQIVAVLFSPSSHFTGDLSRRVFANFKKFVKENEAEIVVVGKIGRDLMKEHFGSEKSYKYFDLDESLLDKQDFHLLLDYLVKFAIVEVFNGRFVSLVQQESVRSNLTANELLFEQATELEKRDSFLFEPSVDRILDFFEKQVFAALLRQTYHESYLANLASRITNLESAIDLTEKKEQSLIFKQNRVRQLLVNKKQRQRLAGVSLWT
ncbi:MAG: F0F1 ATP synthase subunit gamma [Candidatus Woesebacteria bacterium]|jgi:ATP synthase F1 gamma subunit